MKKALLKPTPENTFRIVYAEGEGGVACNFGQALTESHRQEAEGDVEKACNTRFEAFQQLMELIPDSNAAVEMEWEDKNSREAMTVVSQSATDHFLVCDFEMAAAMLELLLELDPEDHLEATKRLAYSYIALEEYELFDEVINDISDKFADKEILAMWSEFRRGGKILDGELRRFKRSFAPFHAEFVAATHPVDEAFLKDIETERPTKETLARELWLQTEHLWAQFPGFIEALREAN